VRLADGAQLSKHVQHALGTLKRPMSDADLEEKFRALADGVLVQRKTDELIKLCWNAVALDDAGKIARAASTAAH
jgi:2-methylcitrate dehydratase PrpD